MVQCDGPNNTPPFWPIIHLYFGWFLSSISGEIGGLLVGLAHDNGMFHHFVAIQWGYKVIIGIQPTIRYGSRNGGYTVIYGNFVWKHDVML